MTELSRQNNYLVLPLSHVELGVLLAFQGSADLARMSFLRLKLTKLLKGDVSLVSQTDLSLAA